MTSRFTLVSLLVLALGVLIFLVTWDIPAPTRTVEIVVPDERLPR